MDYKLNIKSKAINKKDILRSIMEERNMNKEEIIKFMNNSTKPHDPFLFSNMKIVTDKIKNAIANKDLIMIAGDYDCDRRVKHVCRL